MPGHLTPFPARQGENLMNLVFPGAGHLITTHWGCGIWSLASISRVLMYQKRQSSLPVGYKTARPNTGDWEWLWRHFRIWCFAKNRYHRHFLINSALLHHFFANLLAYNQKMSEKSVFRKASNPEMTSQSFPVSCVWSRGFVPHRKWSLTLLIH